MKTKFLFPVLAIIFAVGMSFTTARTSDQQGELWVERNGVAYQLKTETCNATTTLQCSVIFASDPTGTVHQVYMDEDLETPKLGGTATPYIINE